MRACDEGLHRAQFLAVTTRMVRLNLWVVLPAMGAILGLLVLAEYPTPRVLGVAGLSAMQALLLAVFWARTRRRSLNEGELFAFGIGMLAFQGGVMALTGGLASPFVPLLLVYGLKTAVSFGWSPKGIASAVVLTAATATLAFAPAEPAVAYPFNLLLTGFTILLASFLFRSWMHALVADYHRAGSALDRMRANLCEQAMSRARDLEAVSSRLAHELKNPLAAIKGLTQLLHRGATDERSRERLAVIAEEIGRMEGTLEDYLSFARPLRELRPEPLALDALVDEVFAVLEARALAAGVRLSRFGEAPSIVADPARMRDALFNLVANALEATGAGGRVEVVLGHKGGEVEVTIRDTGVGMTPEALARLGTPFFTTRENGTGLGVVLARRTIHEHGGRIAYESEVGRGTTVTLRLPAAARPTAPALSAGAHG